MKIIHFITGIDLSSGGPARSMPSICLGMKSVGLSCEVHTHKTPNPNDKKLINAGIKVSYAARPSDLFKSPFSKHLVAGVDLTNSIAHLQNIWDPALHWVAMECRKQGVPYIISPRGMLEPWSLTQKKWKKKLALALYQMSDLKHASCIHTTAVSEMEHVRTLGIKCPIAVIPNGIKVDDYPEKNYNVPRTGKKRMLFLSRIHVKKGIELLFKAWTQLPVELTSLWELVIAGEGDQTYIESLHALIEKEHKRFNIVMAGPRYGTDKTKMYQSADIFVLPTYSENFGMVIAEAMCCGVPVITTTGTPWAELRNKQLGWYIDLSVEKLTKTLLDAMNRSDEELHDMGKRSREQILSEYSIEAVAGKYKEVYHWLKGECEKPEFVYLT